MLNNDTSQPMSGNIDQSKLQVKTKILLVYPQFPKTFWSFDYALKFISKKAGMTPLGLITIASMLPEIWEKKLVDLNTSKLKDNDILWADYVFISAMDIQKESTRNVIDRCKKLGVKTVAGGPLFSCDETGFDDVDYLLLNEGELTVPAFLQDLEAGNPKHIYNIEGYPDITQAPPAFLGTAGFKEIRLRKHPIFPRMSVQLRILQYYFSFRPSAPYKVAGTDTRRA